MIEGAKHHVIGNIGVNTVPSEMQTCSLCHATLFVCWPFNNKILVYNVLNVGQTLTQTKGRYSNLYAASTRFSEKKNYKVVCSVAN